MSVSKKKLYDRYLARLKPLLSAPLHGEMAEAMHQGKTEVLRMSRFESSAFDTSWIDVVESVLMDLGEIINAPRTVTKEAGSLVPVELAKKVSAESVQHLASHTQYVKNIDEQGNVVPSKIMSFSNDDFLYTYENRFIATFIRRLVLFVEKRYAFIQAYIPLHKEEVMMIKTKAMIGDEEVEIQTRIKTKRPSEDPSAAKAAAIAARIRSMREYILYYYASPFMHKMKNERDVCKPILMTNIIRKNVRYHKCYEAFMFIEKYDSLGMNYRSEDRYSSLSEEQLKDLALMQVGTYLSVLDDNEYETIKNRTHVYKPKMRSSLDEEEFLFAPLPKGPIEFVRVDEEFREYLDHRAKAELPLHPKRAEAQFYADEYADKRMSKEDFRQIERLMGRKEKAAARFEKAILKIIEQRDNEDRMLAKMEEEERLSAEELLIERKRAYIREEALGVPSMNPFEGEHKEEPASEQTEIAPSDNVAEEQPNQETISEGKPESEEVPAGDAVIEDVEQPEQMVKEPSMVQEEPLEEEPSEVAGNAPAEDTVPETETTTVEEPIIEDKEQGEPEDAQPTDEAPAEAEDRPVMKEPSEELIHEEALSNEEQPVQESLEPAEENHEQPEELTQEANAVQEESAKAEEESEQGEWPFVTETKEQAPVLEQESENQEQPVDEPAVPMNEADEQSASEPNESNVEEAQEAQSKSQKQDENAKEKKNRKAREKAKKIAEKKAKKPAKKEEKRKPKEKEKKEKPEPIPGTFLVKCHQGYYVNGHLFSKNKADAKVFHDFNEAVEQKRRFGGKVIKQ